MINGIFIWLAVLSAVSARYYYPGKIFYCSILHIQALRVSNIFLHVKMKRRKPCLVDQYIQTKHDIACLWIATNTFEYVPQNDSRETLPRLSGRMCITFQSVDRDCIFTSERVLDILLKNLKWNHFSSTKYHYHIQREFGVCKKRLKTFNFSIFIAWYHCNDDVLLRVWQLFKNLEFFGHSSFESKICISSNADQARNQLGTTGGRRLFWKEPKFLNYVQHIFPGGRNFSRGASPSWAPLVTGLMLINAFAVVYNNLGCWKDTSSRAIPYVKGGYLDGNDQTRVRAIQKCALMAKIRQWDVFAVQVKKFFIYKQTLFEISYCFINMAWDFCVCT